MTVEAIKIGGLVVNDPADIINLYNIATANNHDTLVTNDNTAYQVTAGKIFLFLKMLSESGLIILPNDG